MTVVQHRNGLMQEKSAQASIGYLAGKINLLLEPRCDRHPDRALPESAIRVDQIEIRSGLITAQHPMSIQHVLDEERQIDAIRESRAEPEREQVRLRQLHQSGRVGLIAGVFGRGWS